MINKSMPPVVLNTPINAAVSAQSKKTLSHNRVSNQSGAVLIISLIMLLLLMLIGTTSMQSTSLEEKMAGNSRDQNLAFQSAEAALRAGEARIETAWADGNGDGDVSDAGDGANTGSIQQFCGIPVPISGLFSSVAGCVNPPPDPAVATTWTDDTKSTPYDTGSALVASQPRYFITYVSARNPGVPAPAVVPIGFMITARGTGGQNNTQVILRSYYGGNTGGISASFLP